MAEVEAMRSALLAGVEKGFRVVQLETNSKVLVDMLNEVLQLKAVMEDHPGHVLVSEKLNGTNYSSWSKSMLHALRAKNKIGFIDGSIKPPFEDEKLGDYALWARCNSMILSWISNSVKSHLSNGVVHASAYTIWEDFKHQFSQQNTPTIYQIQKQIASLSQGSMTISTYFTELKHLWTHLDAYEDPIICNLMDKHHEQREKYQIMQFLMGLNDVHDTVRTSILMMTPLPNIHQAYSFVSNHEQQRQLKSKQRQKLPSDNFSLAAVVQTHSDQHYDHYNREGHTIDNCNTLKYHCNFCDKRGHTEDRCKIKNGTWVPNPNGGHGNKNGRKQRGTSSSPLHAAHAAETTLGPQGASVPQPTYPPTSTNTNPLSALSADQIQQLTHALSLLSSGNGNIYANAAGSNSFSVTSINYVFTKPWILDSGATDDIVSDSTLCTTTKPPSIPVVNLPMGSSILITCTGTDLASEKMIGSANIISSSEPTTYAEAILDPNWQQAMHTELDALHHNQTWDLVPLPTGPKHIGSKWVFKKKYKSDGSLDCYKARVVAKGYT
ncbi:uncharacterized protein [Pyrus communis]|uniref:uncharacterized protein n=1 Tax=Pyrus communis TaxID=23211 RepID=UPI0035C00582